MSNVADRSSKMVQLEYIASITKYMFQQKCKGDKLNICYLFAM